MKIKNFDRREKKGLKKLPFGLDTRMAATAEIREFKVKCVGGCMGASENQGLSFERVRFEMGFAHSVGDVE